MSSQVSLDVQGKKLIFIKALNIQKKKIHWMVTFFHSLMDVLKIKCINYLIRIFILKCSILTF